jgi:hypothetical protein
MLFLTSTFAALGKIISYAVPINMGTQRADDPSASPSCPVISQLSGTLSVCEVSESF